MPQHNPNAVVMEFLGASRPARTIIMPGQQDDLSSEGAKDAADKGSLSGGLEGVLEEGARL